MLLFFELHFGCCTDLDNRNTTSKFGEALLELLAIPIAVGIFDFGLDLVDATTDFGLVTVTINDGGVVFVDDDALGTTQQVEAGVLQLQADFFADDLATSENCHVLQHRLATIAEAWRLDSRGIERATNLVDHECGECFALDIFRNDQQWLAGLHHTFEQRQHRLHRGNLGRMEQDVRLFEHGFLTILVGDEVWRQVTLVELHTFGELKFDTERVRLFDGDDAVFADFVDCVSDDLADCRISSRDSGDVGDIALVVDFFGLRLDRLHCCSDGLFDAALQTHRVGTGSNVAHAVGDHGLSQHRCGGGTVAGYVVGLGGNFFYQLSTHVFERVFEFDFFGDRYAVIGDGWCTKLFVEHHVATLWSQRDFYCVSKFVDAGFKSAACFFIEFQHLWHVMFLFLLWLRSNYLETIASTSRLVRMSRSSPLCVTSVPPYLLYRTTSPTFRSSGKYLPAVSLQRPGPTASTVPCCGFSLAVSGMTRPDAVVCSASDGLTTTRSSRGLKFICFPFRAGLPGGRRAVFSPQSRS